MTENKPTGNWLWSGVTNPEWRRRGFEVPYDANLPFEGSPDANSAWALMVNNGQLATGKHPNTTVDDIVQCRESLWRRCRNCNRVQHLEKHGRECNRCGETLED